jgi:hypothetical protein
METLNGGKTVAVVTNDGASIEVKVGKLKLKQYEAAFKLAEDEFGLTAFICGITKEQLLEVDPEHYENLLAASREVNAKGFFVWRDRTLREMMEKVKSIDPETLKMAMAFDGNLSRPSAPGLRPQPVSPKTRS